MRPLSNLNTSAATYIPPQQLPSSCLETLTLLVQMNNYIKRDADYSTGMAVTPLVPEEVHLLAVAMTTELHRHQFQPVVSANDLQLPEPFTFDVAGFTITFTKTQEHDNTGNLMKIAVSKSGVCTSTNITLELFHSIVTTLMSRSQYGTFDLWSVRPILTDENQNRVHEAARYSPASNTEEKKHTLPTMACENLEICLRWRGVTMWNYSNRVIQATSHQMLQMTT